jgi:hypothetical protein
MCVIFSFKTSFLNKLTEVNSKAYGLVILSIFLNPKSYKYFPRKTRSNVPRILRDFNEFTTVTVDCALFSALKRHF